MITCSGGIIGGPIFGAGWFSAPALARGYAATLSRTLGRSSPSPRQPPWWLGFAAADGENQRGNGCWNNSGGLTDDWNDELSDTNTARGMAEQTIIGNTKLRLVTGD